MNQLEIELEKLYPKHIKKIGIEVDLIKIEKEAFINGANSNYVKAKIINAKIEVLKELGYSEEDCDLLIELNQELKELENENNVLSN